MLPVGFKHSEEARKKISENNARYWLGKKFSDETKRKLSLALKGRKFSEKHKEKLRIRMRGNKYGLGYKFTEETRRKIGEAKKGENNHNWKGGITPENEKIRKGIEFSLWREANFARDNWTCQKCKIRGGKLHSHHIQNFAQFPELRTSIENGITFCKGCHKEFHKRFGIKNNTKEQIKQFLINNK